MTVRRVFVLMMLLLPLTTHAGELRLDPEQVYNGGVAMLRWIGERPAVAVARFNEQVVYLYPDERGAVALLPVSLEADDGLLPILAAVVDHRGVTEASQLALEVVRKPRPLEKLSLPERMVSPRAAEDLARIKEERARLDEIFAGRTTRLWETFLRPVDDPVNSVFGKRRLLNGQPRAPHSGTDFRSPAGTPVAAMGTGRVVLADDLFYTGQTVVLDHGEGLFSLYGHLSSIDATVGALTDHGEIIGRVGSSGRATGPHLHVTMRLLGERIDPMALLELFAVEGP